MEKKLSLLMIVKNAEDLIYESLKSVENLVDEIVIIDNKSEDKTVEIAKKYAVSLYTNAENNLGLLRKFALEKIKTEWVLVLDSDERLTEELRNEIRKIINKNDRKLTGCYIKFQNHFLGKPVNYGGENYKKLILFKKNFVKIDPVLIHENFVIKSGEIGILKNKVYHYSYRTIFQTYKKFTDYAIREAKEKYQNKEKSGLKKIILYPIHMFWARFIKDHGYKDGMFRVVLDLGFAYMEFLTYVLLMISNIKNYSNRY